MSLMGDQLHFARKVNNYDIDATAGGLWTSTTTYRATVPALKRWFVIGGFVNRSVNGTLVVRSYNAAGAIIAMHDSQAAATGGTAYPSTQASTYIQQKTANGFMAILDPGEFVELTFGNAQDAAAYASCIVLEVDI